jgi:hypothetical protein
LLTCAWEGDLPTFVDAESAIHKLFMQVQDVPAVERVILFEANLSASQHFNYPD